MSEALVDYAALESAAFIDEPYRYTVIRSSFHTDSLSSALIAQFPTEGFHYDVRDTKAAGGKRYRAHNLQLVTLGTPDEDGMRALPPLWAALVRELGASRYRDALRDATGSDLSGTALDVRLVRYAENGWIEPHVDRPDKVVTHLFYLSEKWNPGWGGALRILRGPDLADCAEEIFPHAGTSVVMVRDDRAWHGVPPVRNAGSHERRVLLVHFVRPA